MKFCKDCQRTLPTEAFYYHKNHKDHLATFCKECTKARAKAWYEKNKAEAWPRNRDSYLKRTYGITEEQYLELFEKQNGCCAICNRSQEELKFRLAVDHVHTGPNKGRIRGLLCINCNHRLIGRHTDGELLRKMADYVEGGTDWFVPEKPKKRKKNDTGKRKARTSRRNRPTRV